METPTIQKKLPADRLNSRLQRRRTTWTKKELNLLALYFRYNRYLTPRITSEISEILQRPPALVKTWFQNERRRNRATMRKEMQEKIESFQFFREKCTEQIPKGLFSTKTNDQDLNQQIANVTTTEAENEGYEIKPIPMPNFIPSYLELNLLTYYQNAYPDYF